MSWFGIRTKLEQVTHQTFKEPATYTPPSNTNERRVIGIFRENVESEEVTDELVYAAHATTYEIRKQAPEGPWTIGSFAEQGRLELDSGQSFAITQITQTDTLITLYLAAMQPKEPP